MPLAFISGYPPPSNRLLARFLPPLAEGVAGRFVELYTAPGDLVLDPFGQSPAVALEALHQGRRVVVANFNPVSRLALSLALRPPAAPELRAALTRLADAPRGRAGGERLETYVHSLYATQCADCGTATQADALEWSSEADEPLEKVYVCPRCGGGARRAPVDEADRAAARRLGRGGLDYHLLLDRIAARGDPDRVHAEEALSVYPPRTLTAVAAVLVALEALPLDAEARRLVCGLLVAALDAACVLIQERPRALTVPRRYQEVNFWRALENAQAVLAGVSAPQLSLPLDDLLARPAGPAIYPHAGQVRDLAARLPPGSCALSLTAVPRPNQAYWTLSALWSAWLWGRDSAAALRSLLRRRRYDWGWHARALRGALAGARPLLAESGRLVGLVAEAEAGLTAGLLAAADGAGYALEDAVLRADTAEAQLVWTAAGRPQGAASEADILEPARQAARLVLLARGEPSRWLSVHLGAWRGLAEKRLLGGPPDDLLTTVNRALEPMFRDARRFRRLGADAGDDLTTGLWYLPEAGQTGELARAGLPLADRVEGEVMRRLARGEAVREHAFVQAVCDAFPGAHTPGRHLVLACLASYAQKVDLEQWQLRPEDASAARTAELESIQAELRALAVKHGYTVAGANPQEWREDEQTVYLFACLTTAVIGRYLLGARQPARKRFLVLPGGRAGLAAFKLRRDPRLRAALIDDNWLILKFRHVRRMAGDVHLTRATLETAFYDDPLEEARQLALGIDRVGTGGKA